MNSSIHINLKVKNNKHYANKLISLKANKFVFSD